MNAPEPAPPATLKAVLFDLDGTLLDVEMGDFIPAYIRGLSRHFEDRIEPARFGRVLQGAIRALLAAREDSAGNQALFYGLLERQLGLPQDHLRQRFGAYYGDGLAELAPLVRPLALARPILERCFSGGLKVVIATNPVFPGPVIEARLRWAGLADLPFERVTVLENSRYCKPQAGYFLDLLAALELSPGDCLMVGNDTEHDLAARRVGIPAYLVDTWLVDRAQGVFEADFRGGHRQLLQFLDRLPPAGPAN